MKIFGWNFTRSRELSALPEETVQRAASLMLSKGFIADGQGGVQLKEFAELNRKMFRAYDAALTTPYNVGFRSTYGSSDAEIQSSLYTTRARCRTIAKDTPHGKNAVRVMENNVVGYRGFRLRMRLGKKDTNGKFQAETDLNKEIEAIYEVTGLPENFSVRRNITRVDALTIMEASAFRDGFIMMRHHKGYPNDYGYAVDLLEGDRLQDSYLGRAPDTGNPIRFSVELDEWMSPVAYWVLTRHPGDPFGSGSAIGNANVWRERVEAKDMILYCNKAQRAEQTVGFPEMDSAIQHMYRDAQYETAMTLAAIASCCKPYWIKKTLPTGMQMSTDEFGQWVTQVANAMASGPYGTDAQGQSSGTVPRQLGILPRSSTEVPGGTREYNFGEELQQLDPKFPIEAAEGFKRDNLHAVSAALGISYQSLSGMFDNLGFSAARLSRLPEQQNFLMRQGRMIDYVVRNEFRERIRGAIMAGKCSAPLSRLDEIVMAAAWTGVRWPDTNPLQDVQARILQAENYEISPQQIQDEMEGGQDLEEVYSQIAEAKEMREDKGIQTEEELAITRPKTGEPDAGLTEPSDQAQPPAKTKTSNPVRSRMTIRSLLRLGVVDLEGDGRNGYHRDETINGQ